MVYYNLRRKEIFVKRLNKLTDEELAAYMEQILSHDALLNSSDDIDIDTYEVLSVALKARGMFVNTNRDLPAWDDTIIVDRQMAYTPVAMAGFTGEDNDEDDDFDEHD